LPTPLEFEEIVREHQAMVFRTLARLIRSREHLDDLAQEVFLRLYRGMQHFRGDAKLTTYLYRITLNVAQDEWKRQRLEQSNRSLSDLEAGWENRLVSRERGAEQSLSEKQLRTQLESALAELSAAEREVLVLFHQEECTYEQIAVILNLPLGTVRTHLHRGRLKLRERMQERMGLCAKIK
jgi:RNA polymerase sigma-70 factor, ECF subfamily